ncbi:hypothetical protein SMY47_003837 [Cronobacter sakazakii]|uniref:hypothetical protein n=1 Tax=Cronobacter sakazakii TaxID=28141 RepID=UPI000CF0FB0C|nr:hypothetical protein [Cronobacter sakazakii]ELY4057560.1 hypothetical protein [Cronobacter sakazakii]ELY6389863.1 hypothetical protein [Cronobacter sakazakii]PPY11802.1 hypothetical protein C3D82_05805 [Cronobacter sakazakii]PQY91219.1 hypothetical protein C5935_18810 [Cronobacter sakazakii]PQZ00260.1 hypothetical protein C5953_11375 [Cronobacter sakazakii]
MIPEKTNALRAIARRANVELKAAIAEGPKAQRDAISRQVLRKYYENQVKPLGVDFGRFIWTIGVINGVFVDRQGDL